MAIRIPVVVTPSRVETERRCRRRYVLGQLLQRALYYSPALEFGSVIHSGAGAWWGNDVSGDVGRNLAIQAVTKEWQERFVNRGLEAKDLSLDLAIAMMEKYTRVAELSGSFALEDGNWQLVTVEERLELPLAMPEGMKGRLSFQTDRVVWNSATSHLVVVDSKTAGRIDKRWLRQWDTSLQMKLYKAAAAKAYDMPPENIDVVIEGILKDVPSDLQYVICPDWSQGLLDEAIAQAVDVAIRDHTLLVDHEFDVPRDLSAVEESAVNHTPLNYMSCYEYGVECPFRRLCTAEPEERVAILRSEYFENLEENY